MARVSPADFTTATRVTSAQRDRTPPGEAAATATAATNIRTTLAGAIKRTSKRGRFTRAAAHKSEAT